MIVDKPPLPGDEVELNTEDAPPSYDALDDLPRPLPRNEKAGPSSELPLPPLPSIAGPPVPLKDAKDNPVSPKPLSSPSGSKFSWLMRGPSYRATKEVRATLSILLRDLVKHGDPHAARGVLDSCADACKTYDISLSSILQEPALEGHTALYWAIVNRSQPSSASTSTAGPSSAPAHGALVDIDDGAPDLISALLSRAVPLTDATVDELRLACLHTSDHALFQRLRRSPAFVPLSGKDEIITGGTVPVDEVEVEDVPQDESAFIAHIRTPLFQKRMRISELIALEFIAKGRLWELAFIVAKDNDRRLGYRFMRPGSWVLKLSLLSHSPPTWIDSRLVVEDPHARSSSHPDTGAGSSSPSSAPPTSLFEAVTARGSQSCKQKGRPPIEVPLRAHSQLTAPQNKWDIHGPKILVALEENALANSLQFKGCPYLETDGTLVARLEARLVQPAADTDCVVC